MSLTEFEKASAWFITISTSIIWLFFTPVMWCNRHKFPLVGRNPHVVAVQDLVEWAWVAIFIGLMFTGLESLDVSCHIVLWCNSILFNLLFYFYGLRTTLLLFNLEVNHDLTCPDKDRNKPTARKWRWFSRNQYLVDTPMICVYTLIVIIASCAVPLWASLTLDAMDQSCSVGVIPDDVRGPLALSAWVTVFVTGPYVLIVGIGFIGWKNHDAFSLKGEIAFSLMCFGMGMGVFVLLLFYEMPANLSIWVAACATFTANTIYPYILTLKNIPRTQFEHGASEVHLAGVVRHKPSRDVLCQHLAREFHSELLIFWERVEVIKQLSGDGNDNAKLQEMVRDIYKSFLAPSGRLYYGILELLSNQVRGDITEAFPIYMNQTSGPGVFPVPFGVVDALSNASLEIFNKLDGEPFGRFLATPEAERVLIGAYLPWKLAIARRSMIAGKVEGGGAVATGASKSQQSTTTAATAAATDSIPEEEATVSSPSAQVEPRDSLVATLGSETQLLNPTTPNNESLNISDDNITSSAIDLNINNGTAS